MMNLRRLVSFILLVFSFLMVFQYGCGKKGDPVPSSGGRVETVSDLTAYLRTTGSSGSGALMSRNWRASISKYFALPMKQVVAVTARPNMKC
jgi:hypothetical protein